MMQSTEILDYLAERQAVLTGLHFVYTSGNHGPAYINMREIGHETDFLWQLGRGLGQELSVFSPDIVIGPETLGRTLATHTGTALGIPAIWCEIVEDESGNKKAVFSDKMKFGRLVAGKRVVIVDDLLTTGLSIRLVAALILECGGEVVAAAAVVRRTPDVSADSCDVPELKVLAEVVGFAQLTEEECQATGPCFRLEPVVLRPGHGWQWQESILTMKEAS